MNILIIGGGICGLGTALLLARDGHDVTVLERDGGAMPDSPQDAWDKWTRPGVVQFRQPHNFMPGLRLLLEAELPDVQDALGRAGAAKFDLLNPLPASLGDASPRPVDETLWTLTARRPVGEWVFADAAGRERRVTIRRDVQVRELVTDAPASPGIPHVVGVRTVNGEELRADLVVDATGRQSRASEWLTAIGARPPYEERADCGFIYYTRYFTGTQPLKIGPTLFQLGTITLLTLPGDNDTWSVTIFVSSGDQPLKSLRRDDAWMKVIRACPLHAHWLDGEPLTGVLAMAGTVDRYRSFVVDGSPVVTGFVAVADAWACTNPSAGRGLTVGFLHARRLRDLLRDDHGGPGPFVEAFHAATETELKPWYDAQIAVDRARFAEMNALRDGQQPPPVADPLAAGIRSLLGTMPFDPDLYRAAIEYVATITPIQQILQRPEIRERIRKTGEALKSAPPRPLPGPDRKQLLDLVS